MTPTRQLAQDFLKLPYHVQIEVAAKMGFGSRDGAIAKICAKHLPELLFKHAKEKDLVLSLASLTAEAKRKLKAI